MCITPSYIPDQGFVGCRNCWQCRNNRLNDLVGRCIAEQKYSDATLALTLTYAGDNPNCATLVYPDFQRFIKRLRFAGFKVRYIVAGEYGSLKGRAHWHAILFFTGKVPDLAVNARINWSFWPHGFTYVQVPDYRGFKYVLKYALKDQTNTGAVGHLSMSKKPPLGYAYFIALAERYVAQGLSPQSPKYQIREQTGKFRNFWLQGRMREIFISEYITRYRAEYGEEHPYSEMIELQEDQWIRAEKELSMSDDDWRAYLDARVVPRPAPLPEEYLDGQPVEVASYVPLAKHDLLLVRLSDGTIQLYPKGGEDPWRVKDQKELARVLSLYGLQQPSINRVVQQGFQETPSPPPSLQSAGPTGLCAPPSRDLFDAEQRASPEAKTPPASAPAKPMPLTLQQLIKRYHATKATVP